MTICMCLFYMCQMSFLVIICPNRSFLSHKICPTNLDLTQILSNGTELLDNCLIPYSLSNHISPTNVLIGNIVLNSYDNLYVSLLYVSNVLYIDNMFNQIFLVPHDLSDHICPTNVLFVNIVLNSYDNLFVSLLYGSNVLYIDNMSNQIFLVPHDLSDQP